MMSAMRPFESRPGWLGSTCGLLAPDPVPSSVTWLSRLRRTASASELVRIRWSPFQQADAAVGMEPFRQSTGLRAWIVAGVLVGVDAKIADLP